MTQLINTLTKLPAGYGHFKISITHNGERISKITTNTMAIDAAFDPNYDDDTDGRFYSSREEAQLALVNELLIYHDIE
jgi:hypothetical protein